MYPFSPALPSCQLWKTPNHSGPKLEPSLCQVSLSPIQPPGGVFILAPSAQKAFLSDLCRREKGERGWMPLSLSLYCNCYETPSVVSTGRHTHHWLYSLWGPSIRKILTEQLLSPKGYRSDQDRALTLRESHRESNNPSALCLKNKGPRTELLVKSCFPVL